MNDTAAGKYRVLKRLAVGGMAEIYLAKVTGIEGFEKHVVLKRIRPVHSEDPRFVEMFLDEARLAAMLHHQNIAQVYDIGELDGGYFFSMEFLHGLDVQTILKQLVRARKKLPLDHALTIVAGAASGLHYAHEKKGTSGRPLNIVHRDVSPSNIVVSYDGAVKVVDFGIARATQRESPETRSGTLKGKISYMSPEQCRGEDLDRRSDIFSLGIVLYETTTTSRLFRKGKDADFLVMQRIVSGEIPQPRERVPDYPEELERVVHKALAVKPEDRYQTTRELLLDLENVAATLKLPLSTARLSAFLEDSFGTPVEPWHDTSPAEATEVLPGAGTISTTAVPAEGPRVLEELSSIQIQAAGAATSARLAAQLDGDPGVTKSTVLSPAAALSRPAPAAELSELMIAPKRSRAWLFVVAAVAVMAVVGFVVIGGGNKDSSNQSEKPAATTPPAPSDVKAPAQTGDKDKDESANTANTPPPKPDVKDSAKDTANADPKSTAKADANNTATKTAKPAPKPKKRRVRRRYKRRTTKKKPTKSKNKDELIDTKW